MQIKNPFHSLSDESKQINSRIDDNLSTSFNSDISSTNINNHSNNDSNKKEKEELGDVGNININSNDEIKNNNNLLFNKNKDMEEPIKQNVNNNEFSSSIKIENSHSKINQILDEDSLGLNQNDQKIENINIDNTNDINFFNFSFYNNNNNKNNNKNINYNCYKKIIDNKNDNNKDENKNNSTDEESKSTPTNNNSESSKNIINTIKKFDQNTIQNERSTFFSIENSDSNFRKKAKNNHVKERHGDWICPYCENLNFAFRNKCNRCGLSKGHSEQNNNNHLHINDNNFGSNRPILLNNININYIFNSIFPINNINIINNPIVINNINNYYGNFNNYQIYYPCNVNIK
jgi:hypothetical protein